jgi:hypothetical protein
MEEVLNSREQNEGEEILTKLKLLSDFRKQIFVGDRIGFNLTDFYLAMFCDGRQD